MSTCEELVESYLAWLRSSIKTADVNGACEITTPFLDRHNDHLQIYVIRQADGTLRLTDDGYIIGDLAASGCPIDTKSRLDLLRTMLAGHGVQNEAGELTVSADARTFPAKAHSLLQAMLSVDDMFPTAKQRVQGLFIEDVQRFLEDNEVRHVARVEFTGVSGLVHHCNFVIPRSRSQPERLVWAINQPSRSSVGQMLFAWSDTKQARSAEDRGYAILNDEEKSVPSEIVAALRNYDVVPVAWSERGRIVAELAG